jgi:hypothetical protein
MTLVMEALSSSETLVTICQTTRRSIPEGSHLHTHRREKNCQSSCHLVDGGDANLKFNFTP